jgi:isopentenyl diphosphate isomerase/L-lactate dehydrogenase-like FMN-dependent dehydrogenase
MSDAGTRAAPLEELVNAFEFETAARRKLDPARSAELAGSDRAGFDRITFRPRMMVDTTHLDLTVNLFGQSLFAPLLVGPVSEQKRFHPEGELAMARGASAAQAAMVISCRSSYPLDQIAAQAKTAIWYQVYPAPAMVAQAREAVKHGCQAVCLTLEPSPRSADWSAVGRLSDALSVPLLVKGIRSPEAAQTALQHGAQGIMVSNYNGASPIDVLPRIADAVARKAPILVDGGFRRGSDILKALALGATAVLLARPVMWGLAAYGAEGVQRLIEMLQTELARDLAMCGRANLESLDRSVVALHRR